MMRVDISGCDSEQQQAIRELGNKNILVSASAGAGKTKVLVNRIMKRVIEDRVDLEKIIALTFTEAAAQEMKNRLAEALYNVLDQAESEEDKAYIQKQIVSLVNANITTIDSWCLSIIKKYYNVIGLDPAVTKNILSEGQNEILERKAYEQAISEFYAKDPDALMRLTVWFSERSEDYDILYAIVDKIRLRADASEDPDVWYDRAASMYVPFAHIKELPAEIKDAWFAMLKEQCEEIEAHLQDCSVRMHMPDYDDKLKDEMIIGSLNRVNDCIRCLEEEDYEGFRDALKELASVKIVKPKDEILNKNRDLIFDRISAMLADCYPESVFAERSAREADIAASLIRLSRSVSKNFIALKKQSVCLNFTDMERYALEILQKNDCTVAKRISNNIEEIMVDEFQDTSVLQDTIIRLAAGDHIIFRVGDVKQSIYRFRQAKPQLMRSLMKDQKNVTSLVLPHNYRSNEQIIRFTNAMFERLLNIEGIQDTYLEEDHVDAGLEEHKTDHDPHTELILLEKAEPALKQDGSRKLMKASEAKYMKAAWIASRIHEMMQNDPELHYSDFAVLTRSHADQIALRTQFDRFGIPYDIDAREGFYRSDLCLDILAILKYMQDPEDELSLLAVLSSPMYSFSDEQIAELVLGKEKKICRAVKEKYPEIPKRFAELNELSRQEGPLALLQKIAVLDVNGTPFYETLTRKDQANFDFLFDKTTAAGFIHTYELIDEIEAGNDEKSSEAVTSGKDDDVVTATTIHHSKGLEYKNVFLWGTSASRNRSLSEKVLIDDELMLGFKDVDPETRLVIPTIQRQVIEYRENKEDLEEFNRLLYVAVTRAGERLIIVDDAAAAVPFQEQMNLSVLKERKGITGLITAAMRHEEGRNEDDLLEVHTITFDENSLFRPSAVAASAAASLPRWSGRVIELPEILTPSSLERPKGAAEVHTLPPLSDTMRGASYGTLMHELAAALPDDREWTMELVQQYADPSLPQSALSSMMAFYDSALYQKAKTMEIHKEYPFYYEDAAVRMNGTMDFVAIGKDEILLIDFKTDRKTPAEIREMYSPQLEAYRKVLQSFYPDHTIETYAWSFHHDEPVEIK